jgi:hypothetical protein
MGTTARATAQRERLNNKPRVSGACCLTKFEQVNLIPLLTLQYPAPQLP